MAVTGLVGIEQLCGVVWWLSAISRSGAFFVVGEEAGFLQAGPLGVTFGGEGVETVEIGADIERDVAVGRRQPFGESGRGAVDEGQDGLAPEGAVGFLVVGERVVTGNAQQHVQLSAARSGGGTPRARVFPDLTESGGIPKSAGI